MINRILILLYKKYLENYKSPTICAEYVIYTYIYIILLYISYFAKYFKYISKNKKEFFTLYYTMM